MDESRRVFRREGEYWTIAVGDRLIRLRHSKGLGYLARLLREPGRRIPVGEISTTRPAAPGGSRARESKDRVRVAVTKAIRSALRRIAENDPRLAEELDPAVRTGSLCSYEPRRGRETRWEI